MRRMKANWALKGGKKQTREKARRALGKKVGPVKLTGTMFKATQKVAHLRNENAFPPSQV